MSLLVFSYNEGEYDFYARELDNIKSKILSEDPDVICLCTQKSKSNVLALKSALTLGYGHSTKHFQHVFKEVMKYKYDQIDKLDASLIIPGMSENNNVRTRIFKKKDSRVDISGIEMIMSKKVFSLDTLKLNRQAICATIKINGKKIIIVNTELYPRTDLLSQFEREKELIGIIDEFNLYNLYDKNTDIILCGSLNFRSSVLKHIIDEYRNQTYSEMSSYINSNINKFNEFNSLKLFMENYKNSLNRNNKKIKNSSYNRNSELYLLLQKSLENNIKLALLLQKFINSINLIGYKPTCDLSNSNTFLNGNRSGSSFSPFGIAGKATTLWAKTIPTVVQHVTKTKLFNLKSKTKVLKNTSTIVKARSKAMCDRILFALQNITYKDDSFHVFTEFTKSNHLPIYCIFDSDNIQRSPNNEVEIENNRLSIRSSLYSTLPTNNKI